MGIRKHTGKLGHGSHGTHINQTTKLYIKKNSHVGVLIMKVVFDNGWSLPSPS